MNILIFGDSITWGAWDLQGGWVSRLKKVLTKRSVSSDDYYSLVYNLGISGDNTDGLLNRFETEVKERIDDDEDAVIVFAIGINDSQFINTEKRHSVPVGRFRKNIKELVKNARRVTDRIAFVGLTPVDDRKVDPSPWNPAKSYKNEYVEKYDKIIQEVCNERKVDYGGLWGAFQQRDLTSFLSDGLHPNDEGHKVIFDTVQKHLENKGWI